MQIEKMLLSWAKFQDFALSFPIVYNYDKATGFGRLSHVAAIFFHFPQKIFAPSKKTLTFAPEKKTSMSILSNTSNILNFFNSQSLELSPYFLERERERATRLRARVHAHTRVKHNKLAFTL